MTTRISIETAADAQEAWLLRVGDKSAAARLDGKEVKAHGAGRRSKSLWVRAETGVTQGIVSPAVYHSLLGKRPVDDHIELRELSRRQRMAKYGRLEIIVSFLAIVVAVAVGLQPHADQELGRLDAAAQIQAAAAPLAASINAGNITRARAADENLARVIASNSDASAGTRAGIIDITALICTILVAILGLAGAARRTARPPWE
jgi:hypothetical protein